MKYITLIPLLLITSCASHPKLIVRPLPPPAVNQVGAVRYGEVVRAYNIGRYIDPNHPETMEEGHTVYRIEVSSRWDLHPGGPRAETLLNPPPDAAIAPTLTNDAIVAEVNRQREVTAQVMQQALRLAQSYSELQKIFTEMKNVARDNAILSARLANTEQKVTGFERELQKLTAPPSPATNDPPAFAPNSTDPFKP